MLKQLIISASILITTTANAGTIIDTEGFSEFSKHLPMKEAIKCLASVIYHEARGEPQKGQIAVAQVVMNRTKDETWGDTVCGVVRERGQFSWVKGKKVPLKYDEKDLTIAKLVYYNLINKDYTNGAIYFHATYVNPNWKGVKRTAKIGNHIFYRPKKL